MGIRDTERGFRVICNIILRKVALCSMISPAQPRTCNNLAKIIMHFLITRPQSLRWPIINTLPPHVSLLDPIPRLEALLPIKDSKSSYARLCRIEIRDLQWPRQRRSSLAVHVDQALQPTHDANVMPSFQSLRFIFQSTFFCIACILHFLHNLPLLLFRRLGPQLKRMYPSRPLHLFFQQSVHHPVPCRLHL